ncbi:MAG: aminodeoxychorismate/anthranilate synthase component II [Candidatus Margulisbacteria bacterium]|nr:aminodeoxychorismate/anthranilate synthase component II [Candidatus Margulisiibacteriota bacterium]MBU1616252.1 aminodeoxychorismate/anthranilate synthase component II [Candidatus Margulisiibacteriota bacterium]MBU1867420.1 aminodeoxychorismate/anthranilate synthase component II [Candidatus Margulisiibacteriota bacterium]
MILVVDNYDSFTYNLVQYLGEMGEKLAVYRNNEITIPEIKKLHPDRILISPGPKSPKEAGISCDVIRAFAGQIPILGVCLGHQSIGEVFGGKVVRSGRIMHGKTSEINHDGKTIFKGLPSPFAATRYHSLIVEKKSLPDCLEISAWTKEGEIMGLRHKKFVVEGVQFHPESILTAHGRKLLENFCKLPRS